MKRVTLLLGLLTLVFTTYAQKCKPTKTDYDDFTEQTIEYYGNVVGSSSLIDNITSSVGMYIVKAEEAEDKFLLIRYSAYMDEKEYQTSQDSWLGKVEETSNKVLLSTTGKPMTFNITETRSKIKEAMDNKYKVEVNLKLQLYTKDYDALCTSTPDKIRVEMGNRQLDYKVSKKKGKKFIQRAKCAK